MFSQVSTILAILAVLAILPPATGQSSSTATAYVRDSGLEVIVYDDGIIRTSNSQVSPYQAGRSGASCVAVVSETEFVVAWEVPTGILLERFAVSGGSLQSTDIAAISTGQIEGRIEVVFEASLERLVYFSPETRLGYYSSYFGPGISLLSLTWTAVGVGAQYEQLLTTYPAVSFRRFPFGDGSGGISQDWCLMPATNSLAVGLKVVPDPVLGAYSLSWFDGYAGLFDQQLYIPRQYATTGTTFIRLEGTPGITGSLVRGSGVIVPVTIPTSSPDVGVLLGTPIQPGEHLTTKSSQGFILDEVWAATLYDNSGVASDDTVAIGDIALPPHATLGNDNFVVSVAIATIGTGSGSSSVQGLALAGLASSSSPGSDPVLFTPEGYILDISATAIVAAEGSFGPDGIGHMQFVVPIPDDPFAVGETVFIQFAMANGGATALSDIVGVTIRQ